MADQSKFTTTATIIPVTDQIEFGRDDRGLRFHSHNMITNLRERHERSAERSGVSLNRIPRDCATSNYPRLIHDPATWRFLQETYVNTVDTPREGNYNLRRQDRSWYSGFNIEVTVKDDGHRGRGVYAAEPIEKGTRVWTPTHLVSFRDPQELGQFLGHLDHDLQCDALLWAYVEKGEGYVALALDPGSFVNHGETEAVINLDSDCVALRDIQVGEELLENYTHFIGFDEVDWYNRVRGMAWKEGASSRQAESTVEYNLLGAPKLWGPHEDLIDSSPLWFPIFGIMMMVMMATMKTLPNKYFKKEKSGE